MGAVELTTHINQIATALYHSKSNEFLMPHITPEAGLSPIKSTIAENGMGMTPRP